MDIGKKLREIRLMNGYNQKKLAGYLGVQISTYSQYENNVRKPNYETIFKLGKFYKINPLYFFGLRNSDVLNQGDVFSVSASYHELTFKVMDIQLNNLLAFGLSEEDGKYIFKENETTVEMRKQIEKDFQDINKMESLLFGMLNDMKKAKEDTMNYYMGIKEGNEYSKDQEQISIEYLSNFIDALRNE